MCSLSNIVLLEHEEFSTAANKQLTDTDRQMSLFNLDDNNFINNTFSFLDDLDNMSNSWRKLYSNEQLQRSSESDVATTVIKQSVSSQNMYSTKPNVETHTSDDDDDLVDDNEDDTFYRSTNSSKKMYVPQKPRLSTNIGAPVDLGPEIRKTTNCARQVSM